MNLRIVFPSLIGMLLLGSCGENTHNPADDAETVVAYDPNGGGDLFHSDLIREIDLIPLQTTDSSLIGTNPELISDATGYYIIDHKGSLNILRYDTAGLFLNMIGNRGKGPQEYLSVSNVITDPGSGTLTVFSNMDSKICAYRKEGDFVSGRKLDCPFGQGIPSSDGNLWLYLGPQNGTSDYRIVKTDQQGKILEQWLDATENVMPVEEMYPVFVETSDGRLLLRESFSNRICEVTDDGITPLYRFDFGKYNVPDEYFEKDSPMAAGDFLMKREFVVLDRVMDSPNYLFVQAMIQRPGISATMVYGLQDKRSDRWQWFNFRDVQNNTTPGFNSVRSLTGNDELICLVDPMRLMEMAPEERSIFRNPEVIGSLTEESNPVVLKCRLK